MSTEKRYLFTQRVETRKKGDASKTVYEADRDYALTDTEAKQLRAFIKPVESRVEESSDKDQGGAGGADSGKDQDSTGGSDTGNSQGGASKSGTHQKQAK